MASHLKVDVCQVEITNTVDEIFTLEYEEIDFYNDSGSLGYTVSLILQSDCSNLNLKYSSKIELKL